MDAQTQGINQMLRDAKVALKKSKRVDYYKLLEVSQDATEYDIKKVTKYFPHTDTPAVSGP